MLRCRVTLRDRFSLEKFGVRFSGLKYMEFGSKIGQPVVIRGDFSRWPLARLLRYDYICELLRLVISHFCDRSIKFKCGIPSSSRMVIEASAVLTGVGKRSIYNPRARDTKHQFVRANSDKSLSLTLYAVIRRAI